YLEPTDYSPTIHTNSLKIEISAQGDSAAAPRVFELRTYHTSPGKLDNLNKRFKDDTIRIFNQHMMTSIAYFTPQDDDQGSKNTLVYFLAFPNRDAAKVSWQDFRDDPNWQKVKADSEADGIPLAAKVESIYLEPTDVSPLK
ncbi:MAG: NIPSNAP family protein, partial [Isosphaeraceae bacterium]